MNIEKIQDPIKSVRFHSYKKEIIDLEFLFREAELFYARHFLEWNTIPDFTFKNSYNKKVFANELLTVVCEWIKSRNQEYTIYFYWNITNKSKFYCGLVKKLKAIFGFKIWEDNSTLEEFIDKIEDGDCLIKTGLEIFLFSESKQKTFKHIKKHLEKTGMTYLKDVYFQELSNKMCLFC